MASEVDWRGAGCDARVVIGNSKLPAVNLDERMGGGCIDDGSNGEAVGGVVGGLDVGVGCAGALSVETDGPRLRSVGQILCNRRAIVDIRDCGRCVVEELSVCYG